MLHFHSHDHDDHDGHDHHGHDPEHAHGHRPGRLRMVARAALACVVLAGGVLAASAITVGAGTAVVVTRFGDPVRVLMQPGLAWKLPVPVEAATPVDLRLFTSDTGLQDVGTRDGLRILVQASIAWQVAPDPDDVRQYLRSVRNDPDEAARQLRSFVGSALQVTASSFDLAQLVNTDASKLQLDAFEQKLRALVAQSVLHTYGIAVRQVGIQRLSLPDPTLVATVNRMRSERETVAAERTAEGLRAAAEIRSEAARDARITVAKARTQAADIEASSRKEAAHIYGEAYASDPQLYLTLRSLDTLGSMVGPNTRLVLRTDAAPFNALIQGPPGIAAPTGPVAGLPGQRQ
jgi:membrane protease subunit HflC